MCKECKEFIYTSIGSYEKRLENRKEAAINAIKSGDMWNAQIAIGDCAGFAAVIEELKFQLEVLEVNGK